MTAAEFRRLALSLPETEEREHMHHPDFRVAGKIFATLAYPDKSYGMVKLFPDEYFHIGGDEVSASEWNSQPKIDIDPLAPSCRASS